MSLTEASDSDNMQVKINLVDKQTINEDEQVEEEVICSDMPEFSDPAILAVRENPKIKYSRDELFKLRDAPLSQRKPDFFNSAEVSSSVFDPERWNFERKKATTPTENGPRNTEGTDHRNQRRTGDPRERIRKENDGIVLSPQRRSFNSGCFVPVRPTRPHSPLGGKNDSSHIGGVRDIQSGSRRIGSGRIIRDSWDFNDKSESGDNDYVYNRNQQQRNNDRDDNKYGERRSFGRDFDMGRDKEKDNRRNNGRYNDRRRISSESKEEEPEWFSSGPISQNDTIELRGFDEPEKGSNKKKISPQRGNKRSKDWKKKQFDAQPLTEEDDRNDDGSSPTPLAGDNQESSQTSSNQTGNKNKEASENNEKSGGDQAFSFDEILKCDSIPGLLTNGDGGDGDNSKSRFSRWFKRESPTKDDNSRRSSLHDDHQIIKDLLNDMEPSVSIPPGDTESYFAPISPAANTAGHNIGGNKNTNQQGSIILEMLQRGVKPQQNQNDFESVKPPMGGNIMNVDELESKMIQSCHVNMMPQKQQTKHDDEMAAFKKLLAQANIGLENSPKQPPQPMTILEMLNHSQQQDEVRAANAARLLATASPNLMPHHPNDINMKLQQVAQQKQQLDMFNQLMNPNIHPQMRSSPLHDISLQQQSRELLNRPEAQAILQAMHQRIPSPRELQVHTQKILQRALIKKKLEEQQENYRKKQEMQNRGQSPNTNNNQTNKSVSSPTQFTFTPTSVLRKMTAEKDEGKDGKSGTDSSKVNLQGRPVTGIKTQTQQPQQHPQWNQQQFAALKQPAGRPIVKANNNYPASQAEQFMFQQQQQQQQQRLYSMSNQQQQQQQRKPSAQTQNNHPNQYHLSGGNVNITNGPPSQHSHYPSNQQFTQQLTQQQLRAQHQQQARPANQTQQPINFQQNNQQQQVGDWHQFLNSTQQNNRSNNAMGRSGLADGDRSPTSNQLSRWFSPDLLERARGGELPSTAGLTKPVLSLEEIERQTAPPVHN